MEVRVRLLHTNLGGPQEVTRPQRVDVAPRTAIQQVDIRSDIGDQARTLAEILRLKGIVDLHRGEAVQIGLSFLALPAFEEILA